MIARSLIGVLLSALCLSVGCTGQERLTARATPCRTKEVKIHNSDFSRKGSLTAWCAECKGKLYQCASNAERTRVECHESTEYDVCK
jgi:hypothetical protein